MWALRSYDLMVGGRKGNVKKQRRGGKPQKDSAGSAKINSGKSKPRKNAHLKVSIQLKKKKN